MTDERARLEDREPSHDPASRPSPDDRDVADAVPGEPDAEESRESGRSWRDPSTLGTGVLIVIMVAAGLVAAWMATPAPDEEALARPDQADVVLAVGPPTSWDPAIISDATSAQLVSQVYEGLTALDRGSQVQPALAASWSVEDGGRRIVFQLRPDLTFSDGTPIRAEDVRRSWMRVLDPANPSPLTSLLDDVAGAAGYARGEGDAADVGLRAEGDTLVVDFTRPASYFPAVAAVPTLAVVPPGIDGQVSGPREGREMVASGAYVPTEQTRGEVHLAANPSYWAGPPPLEHIAVVTDAGGRSSVDIFEDEAVDWTSVGPADASWIRYDRRLGPQLRQSEELAVDFLGFDTTEPPFDDARVRRAVAMAVDWRRLAELGSVDGMAPTSIVPPGIHGRGDDDFVLDHDPEAARAELAAAGYPGGAGFPDVALTTYGVGEAAAITEELRRELGIDLAVEVRPFDEHSALLDEDTPAMWTLSWSADYPHAHDFLGLLLRSGSSANAGGWSDAAFDELIDAAAATDDPAAQERLYEEAQRVVREEAPLIPMDYSGSWALSREGLLGAEVSGVGLLRFSELAWDR